MLYITILYLTLDSAVDNFDDVILHTLIVTNVVFPNN